jgi:hypothetical protein
VARRRRKDPADSRPGRPEPTDTTEPNSAKWWKLEGKAAASALWAWTDTRRAYLRGYNTLDLIHEAIYEGRPLGRRIATAAMDFLRAQTQASSYLNVLQSMVDTVTSRNGKRRPMPVIGCDDAEYSEKLYARRASRTLRRKMGQPHLEVELPMMLRDSVVRGDGYCQAVRNGGDVTIERFPRSELVFDDGEVKNGWPMALARVTLVDRDVLAAQFPDDADRIRKVSRAGRDPWSPYDYDSPIDNDMVELGMGWRRPSGTGAEDGRVCYAIRDGGEPLKWGVWKRPRFPVARVQWTPPMRGFLGIGLIQQLAGSQHKVNELWADHQEALYWGSALKIFQPRAANVNKHEMRARHPAVIEYDGALPTYMAPDPASRQAMDSLRWLIQQMYEIAGISQAAAASKNPLGPNASGKALDTFYDIESDRFSQFEGQWAMARTTVGLIMLDEAKDLADEVESGDLEDVKIAPWIDNIEWKRFEFDGGTYHLFVEPENFIPDTRGGRLDVLGDMAKIPGLLSNPLYTASLFEEPDIQRANRHLLGPMRMLEATMEMLGDTRIPLEDCVPTPYMLSVPGLAKEMAIGELGNAFSERAKDSELGRYRWFLSMLENLEKELAPPLVTAPGPGMPPPGGGPMPPGPMPGVPPALPPPGPPMAPLGPDGGMVADPMNGATAQLAAGMTLAPGVS